MNFKLLKALHINSNKLFKDSHNIYFLSELFESFLDLEVLSIQENSLSESDFEVL